MEIKDIKDPKARKYCSLVLNLLKKEFIGKIYSVILFGSHARNQATKYSDVDLLIILNDSINFKSIKKKLSSYMIYLDQVILNETEKLSNNLLKKVLFAVKYKTGMFKSFFISSVTDFSSLNFSRTFDLNLLLSRILAPGNDIFYNIKRDGVILYGNKEILNHINVKSRNKVNIIRGFLMNMTISICALILRPIESDMKFYSYEALKWSLLQVSSNVKIARIISDKQINHPLYSLLVLVSIVKIYMKLN